MVYELEPCPRCGGPASTVADYAERVFGCARCGLWELTPAEWNRFATSAPGPVEHG